MPQPGWYADPDGTPRRLRWWDGTRWTEHVHGQPGSTALDVGRQRRGPWPWLALVGVAALVGTVGLALATGLVGRPATTPASPPPPASPSERQLPTANPVPRSTRPTWTPTPFPSIPAQRPTASTAGCSPASAEGWLSDGQLRAAFPSTWQATDPPAWLDCAQGVLAPQDAAAASLGVVRLRAGDLRATADAVWTLALLEAGVPTALARESGPATVAGQEAWLTTGTIVVAGERLHVTALVVDVGADPSVLLTVADEGNAGARAAVQELIASVRHA